MGRGGELAQPTPATLAVKSLLVESSPLRDLPIEVLRKHAAQLGVKTDGTREDLMVQLAPYAKGITHRWPAPKPLPLARPTFKFTDIQKAVPRHCFKRSLVKSLFHLASDLVVATALGYLATFIGSDALPAWTAYLLWPAYWFCQGTVLTGVWVLAHECGHQAFSPYEWVNNLVGLICHSALLVPYHSWRITHAKHHNNTGSCENDEVFVPFTRTDVMGKKKEEPQQQQTDLAQEVAHESPFVQAFFIMVMLTVGWMPGYLFFNATGPAKYRGKPASHFNPWAAMFEERDRLNIFISDLGFFAAFAGLAYAILALGLATVAKFYLAPYAIVNGYLVLITFLQHTDVFLPHFRGEEWDWFRGALCTVDRTFGAVVDHTIHHIADTHVCHHLFSKMPFYHAQEATEAIRKALGEYYMRDDTPIPKALWRSYTCCRFVEDDGTTVFFKSQ